jgi:hypothetical protein
MKPIQKKTNKRKLKRNKSKTKKRMNKRGGDFTKPIYSSVLLEWVPPPTTLKNFNALSFNSNAVSLLQENMSRINWQNLSANPNGIELIENNWGTVYGIQLREQTRSEIIWNLILNLNSMNLISNHFNDILSYTKRLDITLQNRYINYLFERPDIMILLNNNFTDVMEFIPLPEYNNTIFSNTYAFDALLDLVYKKTLPMNWSALSLNTNGKATKLLEQNIDKIDWDLLSENSRAVYLLEKYPEKINLIGLLSNPNGFSILDKYWDSRYKEIVLTKENTIYIDTLIDNYNCVDFIDKHWEEFKSVINYLQFFRLQNNINIIPFLEKHWNDIKQNISWNLIANNPYAVQFIKKHWEDVNKDIYFWDMLCYNPNAIDILAENSNMILRRSSYLNSLYKNPAIFKLDTIQMKGSVKEYIKYADIWLNKPSRQLKRLRLGKDGMPCDPLYDDDCGDDTLPAFMET